DGYRPEASRRGCPWLSRRNEWSLPLRPAWSRWRACLLSGSVCSKRGDRLTELPHHGRELVVGDPRSRASYERRIRIASEAASWGIGAALLGTAALPTTDQASRIGLVASSLLLFLFATLWFHVFPDSWLGKSRFAVGAAITQVIAAILLVLTGGIDSRYFPYYVLPILATANAERSVARSTAVGLARVSELHELVRVVYESAKNALAVDRLYLFASKPDFADGFTVGPDALIEEFHADPSLPEDTPRRRAV